MAAGSHSTSAVSAIALTAVHVAAIDSSNATVDLGRGADVEETKPAAGGSLPLELTLAAATRLEFNLLQRIIGTRRLLMLARSLGVSKYCRFCWHNAAQATEKYDDGLHLQNDDLKMARAEEKLRTAQTEIDLEKMRRELELLKKENLETDSEKVRTLKQKMVARDVAHEEDLQLKDSAHAEEVRVLEELLAEKDALLAAKEDALAAKDALLAAKEEWLIHGRAHLEALSNLNHAAALVLACARGQEPGAEGGSGTKEATPSRLARMARQAEHKVSR
ncbi:hypothetical protein WJX75_003149 [Coccomyxa subellipsoidea]|uniref:Uncharacterized protein n=1 Tax=Coccomyxa subellipsoidea TaxID=248742 RepID=A0ABR2YC59_9CHLO